MTDDAPAIRLTIDEIETDRDGNEIAVLITDTGEQVTAPRALLPEPARVGTVLTIRFATEPGETETRRSRIAELQRRLFGET